MTLSTNLADPLDVPCAHTYGEKNIPNGVRVHQNANKLYTLLSRSQIRDLVDVRGSEIEGYRAEDGIPVQIAEESFVIVAFALAR